MRAYTGHWSISSAVPVSYRESGISSQLSGERDFELTEEWNFQSVSGRAEFQSVEELAEERNFQSVKEWWCGDKGGRVAWPFSSRQRH